MPRWSISRSTAAVCLAGSLHLLSGLLAAPASAHSPIPGWGAQPTMVQPVAVFGRDDRVLLPPTQARTGQGIGLLANSKARSICTAFCVADSVIATAAHCLFRTADEPVPRTEDFTFSLSRTDPRQRARIAGHASGTSLGNVVAGSTSLSVRPPIDATRDWALARLAAPLCRGRALPLAPANAAALTEAAAADRLMVAGFHRDFASWRLALSRRCDVKRMDRGSEAIGFRRDFIDPDRLILHTCDTGGASSGAPLLIDGERGPVVVGINVGTYVQSKVMMQNGEVLHRFKADEIANTAVGIGTPARLLAALEAADVLERQAEIKALQRLLQQRGLYAGPLDGAHGMKLKAAIEALETAERLPATGLPTRELLTRLGGGVMAEAVSPQTRVNASRTRKAGTAQRRMRKTELE